MKMEISLTLNGRRFSADVEPRLLLVHLIRENARLTGTHIGCETSICGACTVLLDGRAVKSCTLLAVQANGKAVTTIEGLAAQSERSADRPGDGKPGLAFHPVQQAFWQEHGLQCGYCTPGMILATCQLLGETPKPTDEEIRRGLEGNLCRCTGYQNIFKAVRAASEMIGSGGGQ